MAVPPPNFGVKTRKEKIRDFLIIRTIGNFLLLFAIFGIFSALGPAVYYEAKYYTARAFNVYYTVAKIPDGLSQNVDNFFSDLRSKINPDKNFLESLFGDKKENILIPNSADFSIIIPKIGANEKVVANVDPANESEYLKVLQENIAHAKGTAFPGMNGTTFLFAHSTDDFWNVGRYNAAFYLLNKMEVGDEIIVFFDGERHDYKVADTKVIEPTDTEYLDAKMGQGERLILQTCWPPGTTWKRLLVFAEPD